MYKYLHTHVFCTKYNLVTIQSSKKRNLTIKFINFIVCLTVYAINCHHTITTYQLGYLYHLQSTVMCEGLYQGIQPFDFVMQYISIDHGSQYTYYMRLSLSIVHVHVQCHSLQIPTFSLFKLSTSVPGINAFSIFWQW